MAQFEHFLPVVLKLEGGYVHDPRDPGAETNKGITMAVFRECSRKLLGIDCTSANLRALSDAQAAVIYKARYWGAVMGDAIEPQELANIICDFYVNAGTNATKLLQHVLNNLGAELAEDGVMGQGTLSALAACSANQVYGCYKQGRIAYYKALGRRYPQFVQGWLDRVNSFPDLAEASDPGNLSPLPKPAPAPKLVPAATRKPNRSAAQAKKP